MARVPLLNVDDVPEESRWLLERNVRDDGLFNIYRAIAHTPDGLRQFMRFGSYVLTRSSLEPRLREIAILRAGSLARCRYEVAHHVPLARAAGLGDAEIRAAIEGDDGAFDAPGAAVLRFATELTRDARVSAGTHAGVRAFLDDRGIVDLTLTVGYYNLVARVLNGLEVDLEPAFAAGLDALGASL
ncbi:MAG TPA: carboxymuconolactone decarboxylase family protein [Dehalococcoidia bacterium]|nr:carboxymuconolactone decarboxylase family protein [Dehalococcoidia bacterium]